MCKIFKISTLNIYFYNSNDNYIIDIQYIPDISHRYLPLLSIVQVQWVQNGGRCGLCGDAYNGKREHEWGGKYMQGIVVEHYKLVLIL